jgi:putative Mg2+ transporter-C (MgtC) family protein
MVKFSQHEHRMMYHVYQAFSGAHAWIAEVSLLRLLLAAVLGGVIGLEREMKHRPAGLRTNLFICFGAAMFTVLSDELAAEHTGDHTRIAAQIIPGIGFIGAGSIIHSRDDLVTGITSAATLFVVASIGMAAGGGLYLTAIFATGLIIICLFLLGNAEGRLNLKRQLHTYEVTGQNSADMTSEINRVLEVIHAMAGDLRSAATKQHMRLQFEVEGTRRDQEKVLAGLRASPVLERVTALGAVQPE